MASSLFNFDSVYPISEIFSKVIQDNDEMNAQYTDFNVYGDQPYWSTIAQNPDYNRSSEG